MTAPAKPLPPLPEDDHREGTMGFLDHLEELRSRLIRSGIAVGIGMLVAFVFRDRLASIVLEPTLRALPPGASLIATKPGEGFAFYLDVALIGGAVLAAPYVIFQVWRFIAPGLHASERRLAIPFLIMATGGTVAGALFAHSVLFPSTIAFFATFDSSAIKLTPRVEETFGLYRNMLLGMIAVFQLPTLIFFLALMRLVTARWLWRNVKYAILISFVAAALLTSSPDPWNQAVTAAPMIALYVVSIGIAWVVGLRHRHEPSPIGAHKLRLVVTATMVEQVRRAGINSQRPTRT
ncbi:MAG TPA: twin-arginine translocase subunit TatC [Vicinamibacterales bacterium]|nr:twin-arginine translocase subunit TatC [Vicinamibacterales bacterium]